MAGERIDTTIEDIRALANGWGSDADSIADTAKIHVDVSGLPPEVLKAVDEIPAAVEQLMSKTAERIREMSTTAAENAAAYETVDLEQQASFMGLGL